MRFFVNKFQDYAAGMPVQINRDYWLQVLSDLVQKCVRKTPVSPSSADGGLYVGNAGVGYMLYYLSSTGIAGANQESYLETAALYVKVSLDYAASQKGRDPPASFLLGSAGVYVVGSLVHMMLGNQSQAMEFAKQYAALAVRFLKCGSDELFVGRAGYLCGALILNKKLGQVIPSESLKSVCASIVQSGRDYSRRHNSPCPLMYAYYDTEYLGAGHGLSSILQMLLCVPEFFKSDASVEQDIRASVDFMLSIRQRNGNYPPAMDEVGSRRRSEDHELVHWCHGGPGVVYLMAKAYQVWQDPRYLEACVQCAELTWEKGLLKKGPGICHGVAGSGYVFLLLYRLTNDNKYLHRAVKFAEFLLSDEFNKAARTPDEPYSLYEGLAGTACFLIDLLQPQKAEFPFFDVF